MQRLFLVIMALSLSISSFAQQTKKEHRKAEKRKKVNTLAKQEEEGVIAYRKHFVFGAKLLNDGYGIFFEKGKASTVKKALLFQLELSEQKNQKEVKFLNNNIPVAPFIYGKENFFYPVKLGLQQQRLLGNKSNKNGVSITANYGGGLLLGLLRPYYVQLDDGSYVKYDSPDSLSFLGLGTREIVGGDNVSKGWSEMKVTPGFYIKTSLRFDYGSYNELVSAIEAGISGEFYTKGIPLMAHNPEKQFFFKGYVAILFGKRK
jgi:hypothetical protein